MTTTIRGLISNVGFEALGLRYAQFCWLGWKGGMTKKFIDANHPFSGAPRAGTVITLVNGAKKTLTSLDRIRINEVTDETLAELGVLEAAKKCRAASKPREDIFHPEYVETFDILAGLSHVFVANNMVQVVGVMAWIADSYSTPATKADEFCAFAKRLLAGTEATKATDLNLAVRQGWLARHVVNKTYPGNRDFKPAYDLDGDIAALDTYVVVPVLTEFVADIESGKFNTN